MKTHYLRKQISYIISKLVVYFLGNEYTGDGRNHGNNVAKAGGALSFVVGAKSTCGGISRSLVSRAISTSGKFLGIHARRFQQVQHLHGGSIAAFNCSVDETAPVGGALGTRKVNAVG